VIIDPEHDDYGGNIEANETIHLPDPIGDLTLKQGSLSVNNKGFGVYIGPDVLPPFVGTVSYQWGDSAPKIFWFQDVTGEFQQGVPQAGASRVRAHAAANPSAITVPAGAPSLSLDITGAGGAPAVVLTAPDGKHITPAATPGAGVSAIAVPDPSSDSTYIGIENPAAGQWSVSAAPGSPTITGLTYAAGQPKPKITASVGGSATKRHLNYTISAGSPASVQFVEEATGIYHALGSPRGRHGTLNFTPQIGTGGRRQIVAIFTSGAGIPAGKQTVATYTAAPPATPGKPARLRITVSRTTFRLSFSPPSNSRRTIVLLIASDGRHIQQVLAAKTRSLTIPVIGFSDRITARVYGVSATGRRGAAATATARSRN
jgi:hypothetical protein